MAKKSGKAGKGSSKGSAKGSSKGSAKGAGKKTSTGSAPAADVVVPRPPAAGASATFTEALRVGEGFSLFDLDARSTPGYDGDKAAAQELLPAIADATSELQERLWAESKMGGTRSLLLVVQGMDTSGKGGIMREERRHPFLWRIRRSLPRPGTVGVFDRSHYEDVLIARVRELVPRATWSRRYTQINAFERSVVESGTTVVKVMLHISSDEQKSRLLERLDRPDKNWKFNPGDTDERLLWPDYQEAYQAVLTKCSTPHAPWYAVPADRKWYARLAVASLVLEHLRAMDPQWPQADYDVATERARLAAT